MTRSKVQTAVLLAEVVRAGNGIEVWGELQCNRLRWKDIDGYVAMMQVTRLRPREGVEADARRQAV